MDPFEDIPGRPESLANPVPASGEVGPFYAVYCPKGYWRKFETREAAYKFIETRWCPSCVWQHDRNPTFSPGCDAEWDVWSEAEVLELGGPMEPELEIEMSAPKKRRGFEFNWGDKFGVSFLRHAGLVSVWWNNGWPCRFRYGALHLGVRRSHWLWGVDREWEIFIGCGPLFLVVLD